jgi:hypothetical protein
MCSGYGLAFAAGGEMPTSSMLFDVDVPLYRTMKPCLPSSESNSLPIPLLSNFKHTQFCSVLPPVVIRSMMDDISRRIGVLVGIRLTTG